MRKLFKLLFLLPVLFGFNSATFGAPTVVTFTTPGASTWVCPDGITIITVECWGGGGAGGGTWAAAAFLCSAGGGAGGGYVKQNIAVVPGTTYNFNVGAGGIGSIPTVNNQAAASGGNTYFINASTLNAPGGAGGFGCVTSTVILAGNGGVFDNSTAVGTVIYKGGNGGTATTGNSGSGGSSGGTASDGTAGSNTLAEAIVTGGGTGVKGRNTYGTQPTTTTSGTQAPGGGGAGSKSSIAMPSYPGTNGGNGQIKLTYSADPTISSVVTSLSGFVYIVGNGPSVSQSFTFSGVNLTGFPDNITVTAPTDFEVSLDNTSFASSVLVGYTSNVVSSPTVYVRLKAGLAAGNYSAENIAITGGGVASAYNIPCSGIVGGTYVWNGGTSNSWTETTNWTPARTTPLTADKLSFNGGNSVVVNNISTQTIGQLEVTGNTTVEFQAAAAATVLTIGGAPGLDFSISSGSTLILGGSANNIKIMVGTGATGTVGGHLTFTGSDAAKGLNNQIASTDVGGIHFLNGSIATAGANSNAFPMVGPQNGGIVFDAGATFVQSSGDNGFGGVEGINKVSYSSGSIYKFTGTIGGTAPAAITVKPPIASRTYGFLIIDAPTQPNLINNPASNYTFQNTLDMKGLSWTFSSTAPGGAGFIQGDIILRQDSYIILGDSIDATKTCNWTFNGTNGTQTVTTQGNAFFKQAPRANTTMNIQNDVIFDTDVQITGILTIAAGKTLTIAPGRKLTIAKTAKVTNSGTITNNGTLILMSDSVSTATIINTGGIINGSGTTGVIQNISKRDWYISNPVAEVAPTVLGGTVNFSKYDESLGATLGWSSNTGSFAVGKGYVATASTIGDGSIEFIGALNDGNKTIALTRTPGVAKEGFNLVGNPFLSYLTWNSATATDVAANLATPTIWYSTKTAGVNTFQTYNPSGTGIGVPATVTSAIPPMQAFWVKAAAGGGTLTFNNALRAHGTGSYPLKAKAVTNQQLLRLQVSNGTTNDETVICFDENAQNGFDVYDSPKMSNANAAIPEIYTILGTEQMVINGFNTLTGNDALPLGFMTKTASNTNNFSIKVLEFKNFASDVKVTLRDNLLNTWTDITTGSAYNFSSDVVDDAARFVIFLKTWTVTGIENATNNSSTLVYRNANNQITVNCNGAEGTVIISNALGQRLLSTPTTGTSTVISKSFGTGVYFVTVKVAGKTSTQKVILN